MIKRLVMAWRVLFPGKKPYSALCGELATAYREVMELRQKLNGRENDIVRLPNDSTMRQYLETLSNFSNHPWIRAFFVLRERELLTKFKGGADSEIMRGALVCIQDIVESLQKAERDYAAMTESAEK
jgi:hypothetical protein